MPHRIASSSLQSFKIKGELDELASPIKQNLFSHINFEGGLDYKKTIKGLNVLLIAYASNGIYIDGDLKNTITSNGGTVETHYYTNITDETNYIKSITIEKAKEFDIIVIYNSNWQITNSMIGDIDRFIDNGISVYGTGDDNDPNKYILRVTPTINSSNPLRKIKSLDGPIKLDDTRDESGDAKRAIVELYPTCIPLEIFNDGTIASYLAESEAAYIHCSDGGFSGNNLVNVLEYLASMSRHRVNISSHKCDFNGLILQSSNNLLTINTAPAGVSGEWDIEDNTLPECPFELIGDNKLLKCSPSNSSLMYRVYRDTSTTYPTGTKFRLSVWCFVDYDCNNTKAVAISGEQQTLGVTFYDLNKKGTWQLLTMHSISTGNGYYLLLYPGYGPGTWTKGNIYFANLMITTSTGFGREMRRVPMYGNYVPFALGVKSANTNNFTILIKFKAIYGLKKCNPGSHSNISFLKLLDINNKGITYQEYIGPNEHNAPWFGFDDFISSSVGGWHHHIASFGEYDTGNDCFMVITKNNGTYSYYMNINGVWSSSSSTYSNTEIINFKLARIELYRFASKYIKDIYLYDTNLNIDDIKKYFFSPTPLKIDMKGDVSSKDLKEGIIDENNDIVYFPLAGNTTDYTGRIKSLDENNIIFNETCSTISSLELLNLFDINKVKENGAKILSKTADTVTFKCVSGSVRYNGIQLSNQPISIQGNTKYQVEFEYTSSSDVELWYDINNKVDGITGNDNHTVNSGQVVMASKANIWKKQTIVYTTNTNAHSCTDVLGLNTTINKDIIISIRNIVFRKCIRENMTIPFSNTGVKSSKLKFNLHDKIGLDWSKDWTIIYNKKLHFTAYAGDTIRTGYSIDSIGCNNNSVGNGYAYWGKRTDLTELVIRGDAHVYDNTNISTSISKGWHVVVLIKKGNKMEFRYIPEFGKSVIINDGMTITNANGMVTQYGYDLLLGGWDNIVSGCYSYRDLVVAKRCLSEEEINKYSKTFFKSKYNMLQVNNELIENQTL